MKNEFDGLVEYLIRHHILLPEAIALLEQRMIEEALAQCENTQLKASEKLGIHRNTLQRKMVEYGIGNGRIRPRKKTAASAGRDRKRRSTAA
jgi:DNA-binding NtrC family response regulator